MKDIEEHIQESIKNIKEDRDVTKSLLNKWSENIGVDIEKQIKYYSSLVDESTPSAYQLGFGQ